MLILLNFVTKLLFLNPFSDLHLFNLAKIQSSTAYFTVFCHTIGPPGHDDVAVQN